MKRLLVLAAAATLVISPLAFAQNNQQHKGGGGKPAHAAPHVTPHGGGHPPSHGSTGHAGKPGPRPGHGTAHGPSHPPGHVAGGRPVYGHGVYHGPRGNRFYYNGRYYGRIHGGPWAWPTGYGYHRFYIGGILPAIFLGSAYFYADYLALGLVAPEPGFVWVRYGPDLVLVNQETGQIVQVAYGVFL